MNEDESCALLLTTFPFDPERRRIPNATDSAYKNGKRNGQKKKEINTRDSHLVPHGSTKRASRGLASKFGMGFGAFLSLWSISSWQLKIAYKYES